MLRSIACTMMHERQNHQSEKTKMEIRGNKNGKQSRRMVKHQEFQNATAVQKHNAIKSDMQPERHVSESTSEIETQKWRDETMVA